MRSALLLFQIIMLAWQEVTAAPVADAGLAEAILLKRDVCPPFDDPNPKSPGPLTLYRLSFGGTYKCDGARSSSGRTYAKSAQEFAEVRLINNVAGYSGYVVSCSNVDSVSFPDQRSRLVAVHNSGPVVVDGKKCCYTNIIEFGLVSGKPFFNPLNTKLMEGCSAPGGRSCPAQNYQIECRSIGGETNQICPWDAGISNKCRVISNP